MTRSAKASAERAACATEYATNYDEEAYETAVSADECLALVSVAGAAGAGAGGSRCRYGRHRIHARVGRAGDAHDARAGVLLWRHGSPQERPRHDDAELHGGRADQRPVDCDRLQPRVRPRQGPSGRRPGMDRTPRRRHGAEPGLRRDDPASGLHDLSVHVRHHHAGAHHRRGRERMKFKTYLVFMLLWSTLVYDVIAHWVWGAGGWLHNMGALDLAGGTVVHLSSGVSALVAALMIGRRRGYPGTPMPPHNLPFTLLGAGLLWFGWFGFNAGSAVTAGALSTSAFIATNTAAASATIGWVMMDWIVRGRPTALGAASGAVAGLVAITPASGFVGPLSAIAIGAAAGCVCFVAVTLRAKTTADDSLDVFGVHGTGGTLGALMT